MGERWKNVSRHMIQFETWWSRKQNRRASVGAKRDAAKLMIKTSPSDARASSAFFIVPRWPSLVFLVPLHRLYAVCNRTECNIKLKRLQTYSVAEPHGKKEIQVKSSDGMKGNNELFEIGSTGIASPPRVPDLNLSSSMQAQNHITRLAQHTVRHNYLFV